MSIASEITRINTNIANSYTAVDNKNGTLPQVQNSANLASAINSIEVIEQATAEGESISLTNTKAMPYSDYIVKGKSEQETRSGKNLWNNNNVTSTTIMTPNSNGGFKIQRVGNERISAEYPINIPANTNITISRVLKNYSNSSTIYCQWIATDNTTIWTPNIYADTVTISFNKDIKGIIFYLQQTANDGDYVEIEKLQIEIGSTATSYEPYGASPSPEYPSEIHSVADDVNLLNLENIENHSVNSYYYENIGTNFQLKAGETYTLSFDAESDITPFNVGIGCGSSGNYQSDILVKDGFQNGRISITFTPQNSNFTYGNYLALRFVKYNSSISYTYSARNIKLQKGTVATPYSPYNQGTVTIKQRGKNNYNTVDRSQTRYGITCSSVNNKVTINGTAERNNFSGTYFNINGTDNANANYYDFDSTTDGLTLPAGTYTLSLNNITGSYSTTQDVYIRINKVYSGATPTTTLASILLTNNENSVTFTLSEQTKIKVRTQIKIPSDTSIAVPVFNNYSFDIQIEKGSTATLYEPYQTPHDYTFQTEPLRSLPNGVKDTMEADGIHRRVGRVVLDGSETITTHTYGTNSYQVSVDINTNFKSDEIQIISNYFKGISNVDRASSENNIIYTTTNTTFVIRNTGFETVEQFKTWLSTHNTEVIYELAEEIIEPLTQNQATTMLDIIKTGSYEGTTNIYTDEDVKPTIGVGYYKKA